MPLAELVGRCQQPEGQVVVEGHEAPQRQEGHPVQTEKCRIADVPQQRREQITCRKGAPRQVRVREAPGEEATEHQTE